MDQQNFNQPIPFPQMYQQPVYAPAVAKKRVNPAVFIIPIAAVVVAAVVVLLIMLFSGKGGYKGAEQKYFSQMFDRFNSALSQASDKAAEPQLVTVDFDASNSQIADYIGFSNIAFTVETASRGDSIYAQMSFELGKELISGKLWYDDENGEVMLQLPDISSIYLKAILGTDDAQSPQIDTEKALRALSSVVSQTLDTYFEVVGETEIESGKDFRVGRETFTADRVRIKLDEAQLAVITKAFLENFINNNDVMDILCAYLDMSKNDIIDMMGIDYAIDQLDDIIDDSDEYSDTVFEMTVWMQGGNVVGREVELIDNSGRTAGEFAFYQVPTSNGSVTCFEIPDTFEIINRDEVRGELHSGYLTVSSSGYDVVNVEYKDLAATDRLFQGEATIELMGYNAFEINLELESVGDTKEITLSIPNICKVKISSEPSKLQFEDMPNTSQGNVLIIDSSGNYDESTLKKFMEELYSYLENLDLYSIMNMF